MVMHKGQGEELSHNHEMSITYIATSKAKHVPEATRLSRQNLMGARSILILALKKKKNRHAAGQKKKKRQSTPSPDRWPLESSTSITSRRVPSQNDSKVTRRKSILCPFRTPYRPSLPPRYYNPTNTRHLRETYPWQKAAGRSRRRRGRETAAGFPSLVSSEGCEGKTFRPLRPPPSRGRFVRPPLVGSVAPCARNLQ